ncbi:MAG TPA: ATP-binding protein [Burkholderiales bacterium]|nr:ATP-binding protein [Burkholderiales bacterium]
MHRLNRVFPARLAAFEEVKGLIEDFAAMAGLGREDRHKLTLIVEELFTNTVTHGHRGDSDAPVSITFQEDAGRLDLTYEDSAPPFDPFAAGQRADIDSTIRERRVGGLGIFITIGLTENVEYSYTSGRNRICLRLSLGAR